jgi:CheY-like chemotaxis protein
MYPGDTQTILLVEGDDLVRGLAARVLGQAGYLVLAAATAGEAVRLAEASNAVHLLVADLLLPDAGAGLARRLAPLHPHLKKMYLSAYPPEVSCPPEVWRGGWGLLSKPFRSAELLGAVRRALARGTPASV